MKHNRLEMYSVAVGFAAKKHNIILASLNHEGQHLQEPIDCNDEGDVISWQANRR